MILTKSVCCDVGLREAGWVGKLLWFSICYHGVVASGVIALLQINEIQINESQPVPTSQPSPLLPVIGSILLRNDGIDMIALKAREFALQRTWRILSWSTEVRTDLSTGLYGASGSGCCTKTSGLTGLIRT